MTFIRWMCKLIGTKANFLSFLSLAGLKHVPREFTRLLLSNLRWNGLLTCFTLELPNRQATSLVGLLTLMHVNVLSVALRTEKGEKLWPSLVRDLPATTCSRLISCSVRVTVDLLNPSARELRNFVGYKCGRTVSVISESYTEKPASRPLSFLLLHATSLPRSFPVLLWPWERGCDARG